MCLFEDHSQDPKSIYINQYKIDKISILQI